MAVAKLVPLPLIYSGAFRTTHVENTSFDPVLSGTKVLAAVYFAVYSAEWQGCSLR